MPSNYNPKDLPEATRVEVLTLDRSVWEDTRPRLETSSDGIPISQSIFVEGKDAETIAELWRNLPAAEDQSRCHTPPFGLRFYKDQAFILEASICWKCSNIFIKIGEERQRSGYIFAPNEKISQNLLSLLKQLSQS